MKMKFFLDENLPVSLCDTIINLGYECEHVKSVGLTGASDDIVAKYAKSNNSILVTTCIPELSSGIQVFKNPLFITIYVYF